MKENNLKAKYIKPYIQTTISHDFSDKLKNLLNRHYNPTKPNVTWWKISKTKQAMIQDSHAELRCNNQSKIINLFSHVTKLLGNINIFDFISIDNHSRFSNKILRFCLEQEIRWWSISKSITSLLLSMTGIKIFSSSRIKAFCL